MTTAQLHRPSTRPTWSSVSWGWALLAAVALGLAIGVAHLNTGSCEPLLTCAPSSIAGGPIGWFAVGSLLVQATWAAVIAVRPPRED